MLGMLTQPATLICMHSTLLLSLPALPYLLPSLQSPHPSPLSPLPSLPSHHPKTGRVYFYTGFLAYILGLGTTIAVMHVFKAAQPALLYLVPSCLGLPLLVALVRGDIADLLRYSPTLTRRGGRHCMCCRYRDYPEVKKESSDEKDTKKTD